MYEEDYGHPPLPTVEECQEFLRLVNVGREAMGLDALEYLDYDGAEPGSSMNCLSARNLFMPANYRVGLDRLFEGERSNPAVLTALDIEHLRLPAVLTVVTDPFDAREENSPESKPDLLRDRMVEAGVVRP